MLSRKSGKTWYVPGYKVPEKYVWFDMIEVTKSFSTQKEYGC